MINKTISFQKKRAIRGYLLIIPTFLVLGSVAGLPLLKSIYFSFTDATITNLDSTQWVWFKNYLSIQELPSGRIIWHGTLADLAWWGAVYNTVKFSFISVSIETILGLGVALILNQNFKGRGIVRAAVLIPWAIPTIISAKMWAWMLNDQFGIINDLFLKLGLISQNIAWTADKSTAMAVLIAVDVWKTTPFMALLCLAALQTVPKDIYDAARIDGVGSVKIFFCLTLPLIKQALLVAIIFRTLDALRIFDLVYVLTSNSTETRTMSVLSRQNMIDFNNFAYGSAQSTLIFIIITLFVLVYIWLGKINFGNTK